MRTSDIDILIVPGWSGSGPTHWQTRWEQKLSTARRINQQDWDTPKLNDWVEQIVVATKAATRPVVLVAHSLGVHAVAHALPHIIGEKMTGKEAAESNLIGTFLVAPPSPRVLADIPQIDPAFLAPMTVPYPVPSLLIASQNDPYTTYEEAEELGKRLKAEMVDAGDSGHINTESGHGPWPEGLMRFAGFLRNL